MKIFILLATLLMLSGCGMPQSSIDYAVFDRDGRSASLKKITISSFGTLRFNGLIAVTVDQSAVQFTLLDSMGITLLRAESGRDGTVNVRGGVPQITASNLPALLAASLSRIYLIEPADSPCSTSLFTSFCREAGRSCPTVKYLRSGPFLSWNVCYTDDNRATIIYTRPLAGFTLSLADINERNTQSHSGDL